ncbi:MAG: TonB-dependent receptor [Dongiaceae bacterium]
MRKSNRLRATVSHAALTLGLAVAVAALDDRQSAAQEQAPAQSETGQSTTAPRQIPTISVEAEEPPNTLKTDSALDRLPGTVQDTPQVINVITPEVMEQQNVTTLDQALRNVPGVTVSIGEGNGGMNGDQFRIRGFDAKGDIYVDGLRDFGVYTRDAFNLEQVQVLKGPSSESFGMGTTGGAINTVSKTPALDEMYAGSLSGGMGPLGRVTIDLNQQVSDTIAVRLNGMAHHSEVVDRDEVKSDRWGVAPSAAFGVGTDTTVTVGFLHQYDNRTPDYGIPVILAPGTTTGQPVTEYGVDRENWYGNDTDEDETTVDMITVRGSHRFSDWLTLYNDTRFGLYSRWFAATPASCNAACIDALFDGDPTTDPQVARGGPGPFDQDTWGMQNITTAVAEFDIAGFRHQLVGGLDVFYQSDNRDAFAYLPARPGTSLLNPDHSAAGYTIVPSTAATAHKEAAATNVSLFLSDRIWFTDEWSVIGGARFDHYDAWYETSGPGTPVTRLESTSDQINPKLSVIYEPTENQSYYASFATSTAPSGQFITSGPNPITPTTDDLEPEHHQIFEVGAKVGLLDGRLGLYGSLFWINKDNAKEIDPITGDILSSGDEQRNRGLEVGLTGQVTDAWTVNVSYTFLDTEILDSATAANIGNEVQFAPEHAASLWTTYDVTEDVTIGGGLTYRDGTYLNAANTSEVPYNLSFDAMASYQLTEEVRVAINGYNLTNRLNYDGLFGNRVIPAAGRTVLLTVGAEF